MAAQRTSLSSGAPPGLQDAGRPDRSLPPKVSDRTGAGEPLIAPGAPEVPRTAGVSGVIYSVRVEGCEMAFPCPSGERLLVAFERAASIDFAQALTARIPVGCRRGGCGVCRVRVLSGDYTTAVMSSNHVSEAERQQGYALSCCVYPESDLCVEIAPRTGSGDAPDGQQK